LFEGNKWARQTAIVVLIHAAALIIFEVLGIATLPSKGLAVISIVIITLAIHRSKGNMMFKGENWKDEAAITLVILAIVTAFLGELFPATLGVMHALIWYVRKKTGGNKTPIAYVDEGKVGSPF
jgi:hypothetical protein